MFGLVINLFLLIGAFYVLIKSADYLLGSSSILGLRAGLSKFVIGLTIIAIGTSLPEFFTAIAGILFSKNSASFVLGTVIGSNISNILFIFGLLIFFSKRFISSIKFKDKFYLVFSTIVLVLIIFLGKFNLFLGFISVILYGVYIYTEICNKERVDEEINSEIEESGLSKLGNLKLSLILILSLVGMNLSSKVIVYAIDNLGNLLSIPSSYLTLTTVAFATSLPEAVVTYKSAMLREFDIAVGNIVGSNISNVFFIVGISSLISNARFLRAEYFNSLIILSVATVLFVVYLTRGHLKRIHGVLLILLYLFYIVSTFIF